MSLYQWLKQDLYNKQIILLEKESQVEKTSLQESDNLPKLSKELTDFIVSMQKNLGMQVEYGTITKVEKIVVEKPTNTCVNYSSEIKSLEDFFNTCVLPTTPIQLSKAEIILNVKGFIKSHIATIKNYPTNKYFLPYLERLQKLKDYLINFN